MDGKRNDPPTASRPLSIASMGGVNITPNPAANLGQAAFLLPTAPTPFVGGTPNSENGPALFFVPPKPTTSSPEDTPPRVSVVSRSYAMSDQPKGPPSFSIRGKRKKKKKQGVNNGGKRKGGGSGPAKGVVGSNVYTAEMVS